MTAPKPSTMTDLSDAGLDDLLRMADRVHGVCAPDAHGLACAIAIPALVAEVRELREGKNLLHKTAWARGQEIIESHGEIAALRSQLSAAERARDESRSIVNALRGAWELVKDAMEDVDPKMSDAYAQALTIARRELARAVLSTRPDADT